MRPRTILICGQPFEVVGIPRGERIIPLDFGEPDSDPISALGCSDVARQHIAIREGMGPEAERDTVLHEVLHCAMRMTGARDAIEGSGEETVVNALAVSLLAVLRQNPVLAAWLVA